MSDAGKRLHINNTINNNLDDLAQTIDLLEFEFKKLTHDLGRAKYFDYADPHVVDNCKDYITLIQDLSNKIREASCLK